MSADPNVSSLDRHRGCLMGLAAGDALGTTLEFKPPGSFEPISDMLGGGPFRLRPGEWTDDTSMALCLAESLVECNGFDPFDQIQRYVRWYRTGHLSSNGRCFDIGNGVRSALERFERTGEPFSGSTDPQMAGNGSIMRLAPVAMRFAGEPRAAVNHAAQSSRTTHATAEAVDACRYFAALLVGALSGLDKERLLADHFEPVTDLWAKQSLTPAIAEIASGSFKRREPPAIRGTGYVVKSLEAALWAFHRSDSFRHGALLAVNLGDDADTTGAVYGQLAGAFYGEPGIPLEWRQKLAHRDVIAQLAAKLHQSAVGRS
jgi:ADP-ribosyl-[dinitrogen reductase] hydrolase